MPITSEIARANSARRQVLRPLPMRVTPVQYERLNAVRLRDGLSVQEHVRRALDVYLAGVERALSRSSQPSEVPAAPAPAGPASPAKPARSTKAKARPKVVRR